MVAEMVVHLMIDQVFVGKHLISSVSLRLFSFALAIAVINQVISFVIVHRIALKVSATIAIKQVTLKLSSLDFY